jgi:2-(1,2-epoxy-1,2-dihydrophenyl)acetyl-CoA isomerase
VVDGVATLRLNRPDASNAIDLQLANDLGEAALRCAQDPTVRVVLLCGQGERFSCGGDVQVFASHVGVDLAGFLQTIIDSFHLAIERLVNLDVPIVAAVRGAAAGGALGLVSIADVVVAADDSKFVCGYGALGLSADGATSWYLPRLIGRRRAQQMFLLNRPLSACEALDCGLISEVVPTGDVENEALAIARRLARSSQTAIREMRNLLRDSWHTSLADHLRSEQRSMVNLGHSSDAAEGILAFAGGRPPRFDGAE